MGERGQGIQSRSSGTAHAGVADITGCICAWDGCAARFSGNMPTGWINLLAYWSKRPEMNFSKIPSQDVVRDGVLCPKHTRALEAELKNLGRSVSIPPEGAA
jgi:hypothetical protein